MRLRLCRIVAVFPVVSVLHSNCVLVALVWPHAQPTNSAYLQAAAASSQTSHLSQLQFCIIVICYYFYQYLYFDFELRCVGKMLFCSTTCADNLSSYCTLRDVTFFTQKKTNVFATFVESFVSFVFRWLVFFRAFFNRFASFFCNGGQNFHDKHCAQHKQTANKYLPPKLFHCQRYGKNCAKRRFTRQNYCRFGGV